MRGALLVVGMLSIGSAAWAQPTGEDPEPAPDPVAQPAANDPAVAKKWLSAAQTLMQKGDALAKQGKAGEAKTSYENAVTAFAKAIEAGEAIELRLQVAIALEKAGDFPGAMEHCKALVNTQDVKPDVVKKAQAKLDELSMKVGLVMLAVTPDGTSIAIGGKQVAEAPMAEPIVLMPGTHIVSFAAVGFQPKDLELKIEAGSETERKVTLEPVPMVTNQPEADVLPTGPVAEAAKPSMLPLYVGGGATIGLVMLSAVGGIVAIGYHGQYEDAVLPTERADLRSKVKTWALVADLSLVGAVGAAAFTTYWYMYKYRPAQRALAERQAGLGPKVDVVPWVQSDAGGLTAVGVF
jgi:hypothetical protein